MRARAGAGAGPSLPSGLGRVLHACQVNEHRGQGGSLRLGLERAQEGTGRGRRERR